MRIRRHAQCCLPGAMSRTETRKLTNSESLSMILWKRENPEAHEKKFEVPTCGFQSEHKKSRTSRIRTLPGKVSTQLTLFDESWPTHNIPASVPKIKEPVVTEELFKIQRLKYYNPEEERITGVSTKLELYFYPWVIKKKLTNSDLGNLCRLLVHTSMINKYVLPFLSNDEINQVESKDGFRVTVWDHDTNSMHQLVLKKWHTSNSYVFNDGWTKDFVSRRKLKEGYEIGLYWDAMYSRFCFSLL